jgi:TATA-box binding protein (TBP) (component of TFIID and TFIIIB)
MTNIQKATDTSYRVAHPTAIADALLAQGYKQEPAAHPSIVAKLRKRGSVIVVYNTGSVVLGGNDIEAGHIAVQKTAGEV